MDLGPQEIIIILLLIVVLFGVSWVVKNKRNLKYPGSNNDSTKDKKA